MTEIFQLCSVVTESDFINNNYTYDNDRYVANIKYDGERIMAKVENGEVILINRNKRCCNSNFPEIVKELEKLKKGNFILDGEIISKDDDFNKLQKRALTKDKEKQKELMKEIPVCFMVFDILKYEDINVRSKELNERINYIKNFEGLFEELKIDKELIKVAEFLKPKVMYEKAREEKREGIVIKKLNYSYSEGRNSGWWYKIKFFKEEVFEAISYTTNNKGIRVEDKNGNSCQISNSDYHEVKKIIDKNGKALINIQFLEKTKDNRYRFPSYRGMVKDELNDDEEDEDDE